MAVDDLRTETAFEDGENEQFAAFMKAAGAPIDEAIAAERAKQSAPEYEADAANLSAAFAINLDEVFARHFPTIYPDHPVNREAA